MQFSEARAASYMTGVAEQTIAAVGIVLIQRLISQVESMHLRGSGANINTICPVL